MKKIIYNILFFILFFILLEFISFTYLIYEHKDRLISLIRPNQSFSWLFFVKPFSDKNYDSEYRKPLNPNIKRPASIIIFGCSFAYGSELSDEENFSGQLAKLTNRAVYNRAESAIGPQMMLYQLQTEKIKKITQNCDYIIYVYMPDHLRRVTLYRCWPFLYKVSVKYIYEKDNHLKLHILKQPLQNSNICKLFEEKLPDRLGYEYQKKTLFKIIEESHKLTKELYQKSKFIILNYSDEAFPLTEEVENLGIKVISLSDLTSENLFSEKYQISQNDKHPNAKAWKLNTPLFAKKIGIN